MIARNQGEIFKKFNTDNKFLSAVKNKYLQGNNKF